MGGARRKAGAKSATARAAKSGKPGKRGTGARSRATRTPGTGRPTGPPHRARPAGQRTPSVDEVDFVDLYALEEIAVETEDGWRLIITRYRPLPQPFDQPLFGEPLLLVHGYSQNRRAWISGDFVKNMLFFGADLFLLELRGHGKSSVAAQRRRARREGRPLPQDLDWKWDLDAYLLYDIPAAVEVVKRVSGKERIFYCGHSLGGLLGYAYATLFDDLEGLVTIGAPSDFARMPLLVRAGTWIPFLLFPLLDLGLAALNAGRVGARSLARATGSRAPAGAFEPWRFNRLPFRVMFRWLEARVQTGAVPRAAGGRIPLGNPVLYQPRNVALGALRPLLRDGGTDEPRATLEQFLRWLRRGEFVCYRLRHDVGAALPRIQIPLAIFFGDEDPLATVETTRNVYRAVSSEYLLWRPVRGNSHMDLTMGYDIRQICYDVRNLMGYALDHADPRAASTRRRRRV